MNYLDDVKYLDTIHPLLNSLLAATFGDHHAGRFPGLEDYGAGGVFCGFGDGLDFAAGGHVVGFY